jgi:hypothetical protein
MDADKEWSDNAENAKSLFLHKKAYKDFLEEDSLILLELVKQLYWYV